MEENLKGLQVVICIIRKCVLKRGWLLLLPSQTLPGRYLSNRFNTIMFENVPPGPPDPVFTLKKLADGDLSPNKVDLGVGVYRNEQGGYHELEAVKRVSSY